MLQNWPQNFIGKDQSRYLQDFVKDFDKFKGSVFGQNFMPNFVNFYRNWANFFAVNGQILKK